MAVSSELQMRLMSERAEQRLMNGTVGGVQLSNFIKGEGSALEGRTCKGALQDGDTFKIGFNYDGVDDDRRRK